MAGALPTGVRRSPLCCLAAIVFAAAVDRVAGQEYLIDEPTLTASEAQQGRGKVASILRQPSAPSAADSKVVKDYFEKYYFPMMTDDAQLGNLANARKMLFTQYLNAAKSPAGRDQLVALTLKSAIAQSTGNYHPAVRYNAVLILGQLDQTASGGAGGAPPKPMAEATKSLVVLLEINDYKKVPVTSAVKMAALIGLERHVRLGVDPQFAERITNAALAIANRTEAPADITAEVNNWMRVAAARILARQYAAAIPAPVHQALVNLTASGDLSLDDRCRVAGLLKPTMYEGAQGVNAEDMGAAIGKLAKAVLADERKKAEEYQESMVGENPGGFAGGGGYDGGLGRGGFGSGRGGFDGGRGGYMAGMPVIDTGPHYERRRLLSRVMAIYSAGNALAANSSDELKRRMGPLVTEIKKSADTTVKLAKTEELAVAREVVKLASKINDIVDSWAVDAEPDAGDAANDDELAGA